MDERYYEGLRDGLVQILNMLNGLNKNIKSMGESDVICSYDMVQKAIMASISMTNDKIFTIRKEIKNELG